MRVFPSSMISQNLKINLIPISKIEICYVLIINYLCMCIYIVVDGVVKPVETFLRHVFWAWAKKEEGWAGDLLQTFSYGITM